MGGGREYLNSARSLWIAEWCVMQFGFFLSFLGVYLRNLIICCVLKVCQALGAVLGTNVISFNSDPDTADVVLLTSDLNMRSQKKLREGKKPAQRRRAPI